MTFVIVPTPSDSSGRFSNAAVLDAMKSIGAGAPAQGRLSPRRHDQHGDARLDRRRDPAGAGAAFRAHASGPQLGLCYNPEFIALGSVVRDMLRPDMILIGESDATAGELLESIYAQSCDNTPVIRRMNFVNAELTKISVNTFVTTKISYANMLADICDRLPGADVDVVTQAVGTDSRIGAKYLKRRHRLRRPLLPAGQRRIRGAGACARSARRIRRSH